MHGKLVTDIRKLESRKDMIKGKLTVAKTQERINRISSSVGSANNSMTAFDKMDCGRAENKASLKVLGDALG